MRRLYFFRGGQILPFVLFFLFFSLSKSQKLAGNVSNPFISYIFSFFFLSKSQKFTGNGFTNLKNSLEMAFQISKTRWIRFDLIVFLATQTRLISYLLTIKFDLIVVLATQTRLMSYLLTIKFDLIVVLANQTRLISYLLTIKFDLMVFLATQFPNNPEERGDWEGSLNPHILYICVCGGGG